MNENILVFHGENEYEIENSIKKHKSDCEIIEITENIDFADLINLLNTQGLFNTSNLYIIRNESIFNDDKNLKYLDEYLKNPSPFSKSIIAINKKIDYRKKTVKFFKNKGTIYEYPFKFKRIFIDCSFVFKKFNSFFSIVYFFIYSNDAL